VLKRLLPLILLLALLCGCGAEKDSAAAQELSSIDIFAMDTFMNIRACGASDELLGEAARAVFELESLVSTTDSGSEIYALNRDGSAQLSERPAYILTRALELCELTGGALDISVYPIVRAWGFTAEEYRVPDSGEIAELLESVDYTRIELSADGAVSLPEGMEIDLGSVAKGYTGDMLARMLSDAGIESAIFDLGGNIHTVGSKPDGSDWRVAIQNPQGGGIIGVVEVSDKAVVTSGGYERCFEDSDGNVWWHIMDPETGYPANSGLISVTVITDEGIYGDALSTALFIMGEEAAVEFWREQRNFEMALIDGGGNLLITPALEEAFTLSAGQSYALSVIEDA